MDRRRWIAPIVAGAALLAGCGADVVVTAQRADQIATEAPPAAGAPADESTGGPGTSEAAEEDVPVTEAPTSESPATEPVPEDTGGATAADDGEPTTTTPLQAPDPSAIDFGPDKPAQEYDDLLLATVTDLEAWWSERFPAVYDESFTPLQGRVYAAYRGRPGQLPGCGEPRTSYDEVRQFVAFYCGEGDFIIYDDGDDGLLAQLAGNFGPATIGIVLAHEYGHAIQLRSGTLQDRIPTVTSEQQADCFAGAWAGRAARGESPWVRFTDDDVRSGLIAMLEVRDPVGVDQYTPGGHGSGFDRVGAFQVGFLQGVQRCATIIDDPLPLMPNEFSPEDYLSQGNAPFGYGSGELFGFLPKDLDLYWADELDAEVPGFDGLALVPVDRPSDVQCTGELRGRFDDGVVLCPTTATVYLNEPAAFDLYQQASTFGDFSIGYLLGTVWAEAVQEARGSDLTGEARALRSDCLTGAWVRTIIPVMDDSTGTYELPTPRLEERTAAVSAGDLDEAVRTVILIGDAGADDDVIGSPFEKIDAFRTGVLGGLDACGF